MNAIQVHQFGEPEVMQLQAVPDPAIADGQVLVRLHAVGVNPVDTYIRAGKYGPKQFPYTPGSDAAGVVEKVGNGVSNCKLGDRVYVYGTLSGAYAEKAAVDARRVYPLAARFSFAQGASIGVPYGTAYRALIDRASARAGDTLLIHGGSGGVGTAAIQIAVSLGLTVFATAGTDRGLRLIAEQGAHRTFNHRTAGYAQQIMEATGGRGVDVILEMLANVNLQTDLTLLSRGGRVVVIGNRGTIEINPRETMAREADIRGMTLGAASEDDLCRTHAALAAGFANGSLTPIVGREFSLSDAPAAHVAVLESGAFGKIVLLP